MKNLERLNALPLPVRASVSVAAGMLLLNACSGLESAPQPNPHSETTSSAPSAEPVLPPLSSGSSESGGTEMPSFQFDNQVNGSSKVRTYPDVSKFQSGEATSGVYDGGETYAIECTTHGSKVAVSKGEKQQSSDIWYRILGVPGEVDYVPAVYGKATIPQGQKVAEC